MSNVFSAQAHASATRDPRKHADHLFDVAAKDAVKDLRAGLFDQAWHRLEMAGRSLLRLYGENRPVTADDAPSAVVHPGVVWQIRGTTTHVCTVSCGPFEDTCCWQGRQIPHTFREGRCQWCHATDPNAAS